MRICLVRCFYPDYSKIVYPRNLGGRRRAGRWCLGAASSGCLSSRWRCSPGWAAALSGSAWQGASTCRGGAGTTLQTSPGGTAGSAPSAGRRREPWRPAAAVVRGGGWRGRWAGRSTLQAGCTGSISAATVGTSSAAHPVTSSHTSPWQCWQVTWPPWAGPSYTPPAGQSFRCQTWAQLVTF